MNSNLILLLCVLLMRLCLDTYYLYDKPFSYFLDAEKILQQNMWSYMHFVLQVHLSMMHVISTWGMVNGFLLQFLSEIPLKYTGAGLFWEPRCS